MAGYGVRVRPCAFAFWQVDPAGVTLLLDLRNGGSPVYLGGRALSVCTILSKTYEGLSSFEAAQDFCGRLCTAPLRPPHPVYGSNNWYYAYGNSSREDLLKDADNLGELCQGFENPPYLVIDDGWQLCHTKDYNGGPFVPGPLYGDLSCLCQEIRERGERPGLWLRPLLDRSPALASLRLPHTGALDPSRPQVKEKIREELEEICSWGFALIKHDFSTFDIFGRWGFDMNPYPAASGWSFWDRSKTSAEILVDFYQLIREATQRTDTLILGCNTVGHLCAGLVHLQRTGDDTSGLLFERTVRYGVNTLAFRLPQHQRFFEVDADCAGITGAIPWEYNRQWCQLLAYSGTPMFVSVKPGVLSPAQKQELRDLLYVSSRQDRHLLPLDWEYTSQPLHWGEKGKDPVHFNWYEPSGLRAASGDHLRWEDYSQDDLFLSK